MQTVTVLERGRTKSILVDHPNADVLPGIPWGDPAELLTPAYWAVRGHLRGEALSEVAPRSRSLQEEVGFCLLGGFGVRAELNIAYFQKLRSLEAFAVGSTLNERDFYELLSEPVTLAGKPTRYRYPAQRSRRLFNVLPSLIEERFKTEDSQRLRTELLSLDGIGPKTASWIVRNWLAADDVAIIDIHVIRACQIMRIFPRDIDPGRDYSILEEIFLQFARTIGVPASTLDAVMWSEMRSFPMAFVERLT